MPADEKAPAARHAGTQAKTAGPAGRPIRPAIKSPFAIVLFFAVVAASLAADLWSKDRVFADMLGGPAVEARVRELGPSIASEVALHNLKFSRRVAPGVKFTLSTNPGVVFGARMPRPAVMAATVVAIGLVLYFFATTDRRAFLAHLALACILGGALGNMYDRMFSRVALPGAGAPILCQVRDFIDCSEIYWPWVFNVADVMLVVGVGMLAIHWLLASRSAKPQGAAKKRDRLGGAS